MEELFHLASQRKWREIKLYLRENLDAMVGKLDTRDKEGYTLLLRIADLRTSDESDKSSRLEVIRQLCGLGASAHLSHNKCGTILHLMAESLFTEGFHAMCEVLERSNQLKYCISVLNSDNRTAYQVYLHVTRRAQFGNTPGILMCCLCKHEKVEIGDSPVSINDVYEAFNCHIFQLPDPTLAFHKSSLSLSLPLLRQKFFEPVISSKIPLIEYLKLYPLLSLAAAAGSLSLLTFFTESFQADYKCLRLDNSNAESIPCSYPQNVQKARAEDYEFTMLSRYHRFLMHYSLAENSQHLLHKSASQSLLLRQLHQAIDQQQEQPESVFSKPPLISSSSPTNSLTPKQVHYNDAATNVINNSYNNIFNSFTMIHNNSAPPSPIGIINTEESIMTLSFDCKAVSNIIPLCIFAHCYSPHTANSKCPYHPSNLVYSGLLSIDKNERDDDSSDTFRHAVSNSQAELQHSAVAFLDNYDNAVDKGTHPLRGVRSASNLNSHAPVGGLTRTSTNETFITNGDGTPNVPLSRVRAGTSHHDPFESYWRELLEDISPFDLKTYHEILISQKLLPALTSDESCTCGCTCHHVKNAPIVRLTADCSIPRVAKPLKGVEDSAIEVIASHYKEIQLAPSFSTTPSPLSSESHPATAFPPVNEFDVFFPPPLPISRFFYRNRDPLQILTRSDDNYTNLVGFLDATVRASSETHVIDMLLVNHTLETIPCYPFVVNIFSPQALETAPQSIEHMRTLVRRPPSPPTQAQVLIHSVFSGDFPMVRSILREVKNVAGPSGARAVMSLCKTPAGWTIPSLALRCPDPQEMVRLLLSQGMAVDDHLPNECGDILGISPRHVSLLHAASTASHFAPALKEIMEVYSERPAGLGTYLNTVRYPSPLAVACSMGATNCVKVLLHAGSDPTLGEIPVKSKSNRDVKPLHRAVNSGCINTVKVLLSYPIVIEEDLSRMSAVGTPLQIAVLNDFVDIASLLIEMGCEVILDRSIYITKKGGGGASSADDVSGYALSAHSVAAPINSQNNMFSVINEQNGEENYSNNNRNRNVIENLENPKYHQYESRRSSRATSILIQQRNNNHTTTLRSALPIQDHDNDSDQPIGATVSEAPSPPSTPSRRTSVSVSLSRSRSPNLPVVANSDQMSPSNARNLRTNPDDNRVRNAFAGVNAYLRPSPSMRTVGGRSIFDASSQNGDDNPARSQASSGRSGRGRVRGSPSQGGANSIGDGLSSSRLSGIQPNKRWFLPILNFASSARMARLLISKNYRQVTPRAFFDAIDKGNIELAQLLLSQFEDPAEVINGKAIVTGVDGREMLKGNVLHVLVRCRQAEKIYPIACELVAWGIDLPRLSVMKDHRGLTPCQVYVALKKSTHDNYDERFVHMMDIARKVWEDCLKDGGASDSFGNKDVVGSGECTTHANNISRSQAKRGSVTFIVGNNPSGSTPKVVVANNNNSSSNKPVILSSVSTIFGHNNDNHFHLSNDASAVDNHSRNNVVQQQPDVISVTSGTPLNSINTNLHDASQLRNHVIFFEETAAVAETTLINENEQLQNNDDDLFSLDGIFCEVYAPEGKVLR